mmetsp:Transcript_1352/g.3462  ORF Transcript_1352/g.3462 Transcript_1352/m.3462 type:complete len:220 (-) Transcript_1352:453-1112(-)
MDDRRGGQGCLCGRFGVDVERGRRSRCRRGFHRGGPAKGHQIPPRLLVHVLDGQDQLLVSGIGLRHGNQLDPHRLALSKITAIVVVGELVFVAHARRVVAFEIVQADANPKIQDLLDPTGVDLVYLQGWSRPGTLRTAGTDTCIVRVGVVRHPSRQVRYPPPTARLGDTNTTTITTSRRNHRGRRLHLAARTLAVFVKAIVEWHTGLQIGFGESRKVGR